MRRLWRILKATFIGWRTDNVARLAAAVAFYAIFSIAPLLLLVITLAGILFGPHAARGEVVSRIRDLVGDQVATAIQGLIIQAARSSREMVTTLWSAGLFLLAASSIFTELQSALNTIWKVPPKQSAGIRNFISGRLIALFMVLIACTFLILSLVATGVLAGVERIFRIRSEELLIAVQVVHGLVLFWLITWIFGLAFHYLPTIRPSWKVVWPGAAFTSFLFTVGQIAIGMYLGRSSVASAYGAAGSIILILLWIYYTAAIFLLGAEFTKALSDTGGTTRRRKK